MFFTGMYSKKDMIHNAKYANNYDYNKAVYLNESFDLLENGFLMIKEDESYSSPIATIFYEYYENEIDLKIKLHQDREKIQCIVAKDFIENEVAFGQTQSSKVNRLCRWSEYFRIFNKNMTTGFLIVVQTKLKQ